MDNVSFFEFEDKNQMNNFVKDINNHIDVKTQLLIKSINSFRNLKGNNYSSKKLKRIVYSKLKNFMSDNFIKSENKFIEGIMSGVSSNLFNDTNRDKESN